MSCIVRGCRSHSGIKDNSGENISFHKFPKPEDIRRRWFIATDRNENQYKHHWKLCSRHFKAECFVEGNLLRVRLKENAVPTINLPSKTEVVLCHPRTNVSQQVQQQRSTSVSVSPMPLATTNMSSSKSVTRLTTMEAMYKGRIDKLQKRIEVLEMIAKKRLLKLNAQKQRIRRLKKNIGKNIETIICDCQCVRD